MAGDYIRAHGRLHYATGFPREAKQRTWEENSHRPWNLGNLAEARKKQRGPRPPCNQSCGQWPVLHSHALLPWNGCSGDRMESCRYCNYAAACPLQTGRLCAWYFAAAPQNTDTVKQRNYTRTNVSEGVHKLTMGFKASTTATARGARSCGTDLLM